MLKMNTAYVRIVKNMGVLVIKIMTEQLKVWNKIRD